MQQHSLWRLIALGAALAGTCVASPDPELPEGTTWVTSPEVRPPWADDELRAMERELAQRLDQDGYPEVLALRPEQQEQLQALRLEARDSIVAQVRGVRLEVLAAWEQALTPDQWTGFSKLPALHERSPGALREVLRLEPKQQKAMQRAEKKAQKALKRWREGEMRKQLQDRGRALLDEAQRQRLGTWKGLRWRSIQLGRRVVQLLGEEVATVIAPHVEVIVAAQREDAWARFELLEQLDPEGDAGQDAELLERFRQAQAARNERVQVAQAALRKLSRPSDVARLVGLGLLPD